MKHYIILLLVTTWCLSYCPDAHAQFNTVSSYSHKVKVLTKDTMKHEECPSEQSSAVPKDTLSMPSNDIDKLREHYLSVSYPLDNIYVNSPFGWRKHPVTKQLCMHNGLDLKAHYECVYSMLPGEVVRVGKDSRSGKYVTVKTADYTVSYCHLSQTYAVVGTSVKAGEVIAQSGNTGRSTGPHLHLTTKKDGKAFDPTILLEYVSSMKNKYLNGFVF